MKKVAESISDLVGNTPMLKLNRIVRHLTIEASIYAKLESFNPGGSVKDRVALSIIEEAEKSGLLYPGATIIEASSGNTGIALAYLAAIKSYQLILVMPESMSIERRKLLELLGAKLVLTPASEGMKGAISKANELVKITPNAILANQFENAANPLIHRKTTAIEIWDDTNGEIDYFVAGVGTGGTISGNGEILKQKKPSIKIIAVEPFSSPVLSGGKSGSHRIQGIGAGFIPPILSLDVIDNIVTITDEDAVKGMRLLANIEGLMVGFSSGAALMACIQVAQREESKGKSFVVIFPDTAERYLSMI